MLVLDSKANHNKTESGIQTLGANLAAEVKEFIKHYFVGVS